MALGGAIGAGFFLGSGAAIGQTGPALLIAYLIAGGMIYLVMRALGELTLAHPSPGSFAAYTVRFIGPLAGFMTGWMYWLAFLLVGIAEITGIGLLLHRWYPGIPQWLPALCATVMLYAINMRTVKSFGESEYWLSMIKVVTIVAILLSGLAILVFKIGDVGAQAHVANLWQHGGILPKGFSGLLAALPVVIFSFGGTEVIGLAAAETDRPEYTLPRAINGVFFRIMLFYVGSLAIVMILHPWNSLDPKESPFVSVLKQTGFVWAAGTVTFVAISAFFSSSNTILYGSSRLLHAMALSGAAPARFQALNRRKIPYLSVTLSGAVLMLGVVLNYLMPDKIFGYLLSTVVWIVLWVWASIMLCHLSYCRRLAKGSISRGSFRLPGAPYTNWAILFLIALVALLVATNGQTRVTFIIILLWSGILVAAYYAKGSRQPTMVEND
ncbi:amino acid permease-associated region [Terriglobus saanensis SP1PR4]|uniref:Amino acid permease-associated region n=2 Tax=Terriglobus saanensis TaxID=870903 RepID=E8UY52_TERSS|nr:amino acid permease-associated region [Terriglobus saanensis SP1PR4]